MTVLYKYATPLSTVGLPTSASLDDRHMYDLEMLMSGAFAPLTGFLGYSDFCSVVERGQLATGEIWPMPIILPITVDLESTDDTENKPMTQLPIVTLRDSMHLILAELHVQSAFRVTNWMMLAEMLLGSSDVRHPYCSYLKDLESRACIGGVIKPIHKIQHFDFAELRLTPHQVKQHAKTHGWKHIVGFQTRNPMHRSHFELTVQAVKEVSKSTGGEKVHLLLTPVCGVTQVGDIPYHIRVRCYKELLPHYEQLSKEGVMGDVKLVLIPLAMRMAGPKEALFHALIRKNYGCTHFIVGRDHAGPSALKQDGTKFYKDYEAHELLLSFKDRLGITPVFGKAIVYAESKHGSTQSSTPPLSISSQSQELYDTTKDHKMMGDASTCMQTTSELTGYFLPEDQPVPKDAVVFEISGTELRKRLRQRHAIPEWYSFPAVIKELQSFYRPYCELGFCVYLTGLPCSGKTTLAQAIHASLLELSEERRHVTFLDADIIRTNLCSGLGFDRQSRQTNVRRIGYVASLIVESGGICIVANIAPFTEDRQHNRATISKTGAGYIEVYVSTPLEVCESRDVKGQYKRARLGMVEQFTGVSDSYEPPVNAELVVDSSSDILGKVKMVMSYLKEKQWIR